MIRDKVAIHFHYQINILTIKYELVPCSICILKFCYFLLQKQNNFTEDLITFDVEEKHVKKPIIINDEVKCLGDSSPEY